MLSLKLTSKKFWDNKVEGYVFFLREDFKPASTLSSIDFIEEEYFPRLKVILKKHNFEGKAGQSFVLSNDHGNDLIQFIFIGLGNPDKDHLDEMEKLRRATGTTIQLLKKLSIKDAVIALPDKKDFKVGNDDLIKQIVITSHMADYEYITFKSDKKDKPFDYTLSILVKEATAAVKNAFKEGGIIGQAINDTRHRIDAPANIMTPDALSKEAEKIAKKHSLKSTVLGRQEAEKLGMGAFCAVDAGSVQEGKFVVLEYHTKIKNAPTIALCGKGITFDTGGISLKPSSSMTGMKFDMSGAAAVIAVMDIIGQLKPKINVIGITPMAENMPSGNASRQDDVIVAMNGKSIEIKNTDAEGRLVLADALCYAESKYKPDVIIDVATLTGACLHALGHFYTGLMTEDTDLCWKLEEAAERTGDKVWQLPMDADFKKANKSEVADIANTGSPAYLAGTIIGACFLSAFVEKTPWAHLDIAGTADGVPGINYLSKGATGAGVRLLTDFVMNYKK